MNKSICVKTSVVVVGLALATNAFADRAYLSLGYNFTNMRDSGFDLDSGHVKTETDEGTGYAVAFGYESGGIRTELEYISTSADVESHIFEGVRLADNTGELSIKNGAMVNVYYDFNHRSAIKPYIGGGIGAAEIEAYNFGADGVQLLSDNDTALAAQIIGGVAAEIGPNIDFFVDIRYLEVIGAEMTTTAAGGGNETDIDYRNQIAKAGFRARF
ncbi:outer membrane beta-barrel protein [Gammaproteobacteria bacterium]|nr:outer membrane beta-barrel protein [Gammaproteobacteria bacterium]